MDRPQLADFLRRRREALQPGDVGLPPGLRRRAAGLRREEVAGLASMSTDYYTRLEQRRGPQPSESILAALARALRLTQDERDHLFRLAGRTPPPRSRSTDHVSPALLRVLDRLDTPAMVVSDLAVTRVQNPAAVALLGEQTRYAGLSRYQLHRWYHRPGERDVYPTEDQPYHERQFVAGLRAVLGRDPGDQAGQELLAALRRDARFRAAWAEHDVAVRTSERKRIVSPTVGLVEVDCQKLANADDGQTLLVFTATPGTESQDKLRLLEVLGPQQFSSDAQVGVSDA